MAKLNGEMEMFAKAAIEAKRRGKKHEQTMALKKYMRQKEQVSVQQAMYDRLYATKTQLEGALRTRHFVKNQEAANAELKAVTKDVRCVHHSSPFCPLRPFGWTVVRILA